MNDSSNLSVVILTYNEEKHIARCIESLLPITRDIFIVDSYSTDRTVEIATALGAKVYQNKWPGNHAIQFQWGLDNCPIATEWVMKMDSDEYILPELADEIHHKIDRLEDSTAGIYIKRRVNFMDRWIKHGSYYPIWLLRIWRYKQGKIEERWMDEHIKLSSGNTVQFENDLVDDNKNNLSWWTEKHNNYATREAVDILNILHGFIKYDEVEPNLWGTQEQRKRWLKIRYASLPLFVRPVLYFHWRYFFKLGFLDGRQGLVWHFLQGFWYRFLVDAKIYQIHHIAKKENKSLKQVIKDDFGLDLDATR
jgi:glycosyltransferase involved in cell wall biosynthesis